MAEFEHEVAVAKLEHESALAEPMEVPRPKIPMLSEAAVVELEATMRPMEVDARVGRKMAERGVAIASLPRLRRDYLDREDGCQDHDPAHRLTPVRAQCDS
jgi:hypothetical protein